MHFISAVVIGCLNGEWETQAPKQPWWWVTMGTASIWKGDDQIPVCQYSKDKMFVTFDIGKLLSTAFFLSYFILFSLGYLFPFITPSYMNNVIIISYNWKCPNFFLGLISTWKFMMCKHWPCLCVFSGTGRMRLSHPQRKRRLPFFHSPHQWSTSLQMYVRVLFVLHSSKKSFIDS